MGMTVIVPSAHAQQSSSSENPDKRILGVIPNFKTVPSRSGPYVPLSTEGKFHLATEESWDFSVFLLAGMYAGVEQAENQYPSFGQEQQGYAKRYGGAFADLAIGNYLTEAILPTVLHDDPRYFRMAEGGFFKRTAYAVSRTWLTRTDSGGDRFNVPELAGNAMAAGISTLYYPAADRTASQVLGKWGFQIGTDAALNVLKEFWPDIRRKVFPRWGRRDDAAEPCNKESCRGQ